MAEPDGPDEPVKSLGRLRPDLAPSLRMVSARAFEDDAPVWRDDLLTAVLRVWAPPELLAAMQALPDGGYHEPDDVAALLLPVVAGR